MRRRSFIRSAAAGFAAPALEAAQQAKGELKITGMRTDLLRFPPGRPFSDAIHTFGPQRGGVVLRLDTNAGIIGWAYLSRAE